MMNTKTHSNCAAWAWPVPSNTVNAGFSCAAFILMGIYIVVLPIAHTIAIRHIAFFSLLLLTLWAAWRQGLKLRLPIAWPLVIYAIVALISVTYAIDPAYSLGEVKKEVGYGMIALMLAASWVRSAEAMSRLTAVIIAANILMVGYSLFNLVGKPWSLVSAGQEGSFSGVGVFSTYLITVIPFITAYIFLLPNSRKIIRYLLIVLLIMNLAALYYTGNRMSPLTLVVELGIAVYLIGYRVDVRARRVLLLVGAALIVFIGAWFVKGMHDRNVSLFVNDGQGAHVTQDPRWMIWKKAIENTLDQPLTGGGFGREAFKLRNPEMPKLSRDYWHGHNMFLDKGVQMGIPGILAFLVVFAAVLRAVWIPRNRPLNPADVYALACVVMVAGTVVKSMTDDFFIQDSALLFWVLVGSVIGALSGERAQRHEPLVHSSV